MRHLTFRERGQGLVEYALILVLVAIVVIAILLMLGPVVGNVFSNVVAHLDLPTGPGHIASVGTAPVAGNVVVTVTVSQATTVTLSITNGSGTIIGANPKACSGSCTFTITGPSVSGTVQAAAGGGHRTANW
jgi:pilus assembly protein Flp/PilA